MIDLDASFAKDPGRHELALKNHSSEALHRRTLVASDGYHRDRLLEALDEIINS